MKKGIRVAKGIWLTIGICFGLALLSCGSENPGGYKPVEGDVIFQSFGRDELSQTIEGATDSRYSHCGIVARQGGEWVVLEAVGPVKATALSDWTARGVERAFAVFRLRNEHRKHIEGMIAAAREFKGRPYDIHFEMGDNKIYCSELVYKAFKNAGGGELGKLQKLGDLKWKPHEEFIRKIENGGLPLDRVMITPRALSEASQLEKVFSKGFD